MSTKVTFQKILNLLESVGQKYELISSEEYFEKQRGLSSSL